MKKFKNLILIAILSVLATFSALVALPSSGAYAACDTTSLNVSSGAECGNQTGVSNLFGTGGIITTIINVILFIVGILSVVMLIYGGIKYTTSAGDTAKVTSAKNTVMYAIVGLIVAILAFAIVNFVIGNIKGDG